MGNKLDSRTEGFLGSLALETMNITGQQSARLCGFPQRSLGGSDGFTGTELGTPEENATTTTIGQD